MENKNKEQNKDLSIEQMKQDIHYLLSTVDDYGYIEYMRMFIFITRYRWLPDDKRGDING